MQTIKLEIDDSKVDVVISIIKNLKDGIVTKYEVQNDNKELIDFVNISQKPFEKVWENDEDSVYDKFLKV